VEIQKALNTVAFNRPNQWFMMTTNLRVAAMANLRQFGKRKTLRSPYTLPQRHKG